MSPLACTLIVCAICADPPAATNDLACWLPSARQAQLDFEKSLNAVPTPASLRAYHEMLANEPHVAGTPGDAREIQRMAKAFREMGLEVEIHDFWAYLCLPVDAALQIINPAAESAAGGMSISGASAIDLPLKESPLREDHFADHRDLHIGWNAYSGNGDVTAEVVYANYGTKEDFATLRELNIDCTGKIVIARYGRNFRGYKAKFAEAAGAAGLIIYPDPDDSGYRQGVAYPEGGFANDTYIQRGSIETLDYPGDPLTPFEPATQEAKRLDPKDVALPKIPVQPIGFGAANQIMSRMTGTPLPNEIVKSWQGGLPLAYRLTGGTDLKVRLMVKQERKVTKTANVVATLKGSKHPEQKIIIGCHHDAWGFGAADPLAGTILLFESAKSFADAAKRGVVPERSVVFAAWGAEEFGIMGSTEWCEANRDDLVRNGVAYINLDMAAMGTDFGASAAPTLQDVIAGAIKTVPQARDAERTVHETWMMRLAKAKQTGEAPGSQPNADQLAAVEPTFDVLGGGSDHAGFYCHLGIPSCAIGAGGSRGTSYHSNYDNLDWYRKVVGEDYEPALMLTRVLNVIAARLANASVLPLDPVRYADESLNHLKNLETRATTLGVATDFAKLREAIDVYRTQAELAMAELHRGIEANALSDETMRKINAMLLMMERAWLDEKGIGDRPWFRSLFACNDPDSGYAAWVLPGLREPIEKRDAAGVTTGAKKYVEVFRTLTKAVTEMGLAARSDARQ